VLFHDVPEPSAATNRGMVRSLRGFKMKRRWIILLALIVTLLLVAFIAVTSYVRSFDYTLTEINFTRDALTVVETHSSLKLPDKSRGLNMVYEGSRGDPAFVAKIEIPSDAADSLKQQIEKQANEDYNSIGALSERMPWWNPAQLKVVSERKYTVNNSYVHVLLCYENKRVVLFVESMSF
jgi:hypothetical protein